VVEPILGEGGAVSPRPGFLREAQAMCRKAGALLVVDEVQTGMGRTGAMFAFSKDGVVPDAVCLAKALGGGLMPVGAMVARGEVFARAFGTAATCRLHATTFGGGPLAMAAVLATLDTLREEKLVERAAVEGRYLEDRLRELARRHKTIREVRGRGLMLALKFQDASRGLLDRTPFAKLSEASASLLVQHVALQLMKEHKIVAQLAGNDGSVLKVMPPLVVAREESDRFVAALDQILEGAGHAKALASLAAEVVKARL
jgi:putrescine aminotransferase